MEETLAKAHSLAGNMDQSNDYKGLAAQRKKAIQTYFWNENAGYYQDYNFEKGRLTLEPTLAGMTPLFFGLASEEQAEKVKDVIMSVFLKDGGLVTTLDHSGQQWDAPNGWAPLQWLAVNGLLNYGYTAEAKEIMTRWLTLNEKVYANTGKMMEKYNVEDLTLLSGGGEYPTQDGFGWTNGVALGFKQLLERLEQPD
jgi:alpha,alpha-trehalase